MAKKGQEPDLEATAATEAAPIVKKPGRKGGPLIYVVISVVMIALGYFGGTKFLGKSGDKQEAEVSEAANKDESHGTPEKTEMVMVDDIIVNPSGTGGTRFLSCSIGFEVGSEEAVKQFESRRPMIRDALITILGSKTLEQLSDAKEKEITRYQIKKRVEQLMNSKDVQGVYFTDFVLQ
jgi:flagellar FliL protein